MRMEMEAKEAIRRKLTPQQPDKSRWHEDSLRRAMEQSNHLSQFSKAQSEQMKKVRGR